MAVAFAEILEDFKIEKKVRLDNTSLPLTALNLSQILSITSDNATSMDTLCEHLDDHLSAFDSANRTCCFAHILNLVAKSLLKQFDVKKKKNDSHDETNDDDDRDPQVSDEEHDLLDLADSVDAEELTMAQENDIGDEDEVEEDDEDGWVDELEALTEKEWENLKVILRPVSKMLIKVSN